MKRLILWTGLGLLTASLLVTLLTLPPATVRLAVTLPDTTLAGAYHIHTNRSDGSGSVDDVAQAAARAGLHFVILTDHGDAARPPDPPAYRHGVLVIDAVEISTRDGHVVALGLDQAAPYPLGGEGRDVLEDIRRLGGWAVAAHPDSPKADLQWRGPATDGLEWINADSEWRDEAPARLLHTAAHALIRSPPAIASVFRRPDTSLRRWSQWSRARQVAGLAAVDAHARIGLDEHEEPRASRTLLARPSYETMFRTVTQHVWLTAPPTGDAAADARAVLAALRTGQSYSVVAALAGPAVLRVQHDAAGHTLSAEVTGAPADAELGVRVGTTWLGRGTGVVTVPATTPGQYVVEVGWPGADVPWIVSGPLHIAGPAPAAPAAPDDAAAAGPITHTLTESWHVEKHPATTATWTREASGGALSFTLGPGRPNGQYAAIVQAAPADLSVDTISFTVSAPRPMRVSVQVRLPESAGGERWVRSVYADATPRAVTLPLREFTPADRPTSRRPIAARLGSILFVVDAPNTPPGTTGRFSVSQVTLSGAPITSAR